MEVSFLSCPPNTANLSLRNPAPTETAAELRDAVKETLRKTAPAGTQAIRTQISVLWITQSITSLTL